MANFDVYFSPTYGYKAVKKGFLNLRSQGSKLGKKGYRHVGTTYALSPEEAIRQTRSESFDTRPEFVRSGIKAYHDTEQVEALENAWASSVILELLLQHNLDPDDIPDSYLITLKTLVLSLKDKNMSEDNTIDTVNQLTIKHGSLFHLLKTYSEMFGIY